MMTSDNTEIGTISDKYEPHHNSAFYFPLFKRPIHPKRLSLAQLVMIYHNTTAEQFEQTL